MFNFTDKVSVNPKKKTQGKNSCKYIILHHTGSKNYKGDLNVLRGNTGVNASCHFLVGSKGETAKIGDPTDILWHVGVSEWGNEKRIGNSLNHCCLGIEITGPLDGGGFTKEQKVKVKELTEHLMAAFGIDNNHVLRHCDLTHKGSKNNILRKKGTVGRKRDVSETFFDGIDFDTRRETLVPKLAG